MYARLQNANVSSHVATGCISHTGVGNCQHAKSCYHAVHAWPSMYIVAWSLRDMNVRMQPNASGLSGFGTWCMGSLYSCNIALLYRLFVFLPVALRFESACDCLPRYSLISDCVVRSRACKRLRWSTYTGKAYICMNK